MNSVAGAVSDGGPFLLVRVFRWREGIRHRNDFAGALMSDNNPNYLVWRERIYEGLAHGRGAGGVMSALGRYC